jgi:putative DNA primase/helicase
VQKFAHGEALLTLEEAGKHNEYAGVLNGDFAVCDVDDSHEAESLRKIVEAKNLNCRIYRTTRGMHFVFRSSAWCKKSLTEQINAFGLGFDTRAGRNSYIVLKFRGVVREIVRDFDESRPIDEYPRYLAPLKGAERLSGFADGAGRNAALFKHARLLTRYRYSRDDAREICGHINKYVFAEALPSEELSKILREETFRKATASGGEGEGQTTLSEAFLTQYLAERGITLRYNVINKNIEIKGLEGGYNPETLQNDLPIILYDSLKSAVKKCDKGSVQDLLGVIAGKNRFNPVLELLASAVWDGTDRVETFCSILGIPESDTLSRTLIYKWLWQSLSMPRNELENAYGADGILVLQGAQGIGKTSVARKLAVTPSLCKLGQHLDSRDKDTYRRAVSAWIVEFGEIEATFKSDIEKLKAFITNAVDEYRLPYGRADQTLARRTVIMGTCNSERFLIDPTGSRRFWTVPLTNIDLAALAEFDALQLWLQVDTATKDNPQGFRLTKEEQAALAVRNCAHERLLPAEAEILDIMAKDEVIMRDATVSEFKAEHRELAHYTADQIGRALTHMGIEQRVVYYTGNGRRTSARVRHVPMPMGSVQITPLTGQYCRNSA